MQNAAGVIGALMRALQSEYTAACDGRREFISGFTGSAGEWGQQLACTFYSFLYSMQGWYL